MKVLVIGGAGYIGSHVALELLQQGHQADVYDNFSTGQRVNIFKESKLYEADILDNAVLNKVLAGYDAVIHLAASKAVGESMVNPQKYSTNNIEGSLNILNAMALNNVKHLVFSSSAAIFGEPQYLPIDEEHLKNPTNYYGFTKLKIEEFMAWYSQLLGLNYAGLRYFNACGYDSAGRIKGLEQNPANLLPIIMEVAVGRRTKLEIFGDDYPTPDGTCVRDYIHVSDLASAHLKALEYIRHNNKNILLNLGSETGISVKEMYEAACRITGKTLPYSIAQRRAGDPAGLVATSQLAQKMLQWQVQHSSLEELIESSYRAYLAHFKVN